MNKYYLLRAIPGLACSRARVLAFRSIYSDGYVFCSKAASTHTSSAPFSGILMGVPG